MPGKSRRLKNGRDKVTIKTVIASASFAVATVIAGLSATAPAVAQFKEQTIPAECLDEHGRFVLTGANYDTCAPYGRV